MNSKILFIDSNKNYLETMTQYLRWYDFEVFAWEDSFSVINHLRKNAYDLCVCDMFCQPLSGYRLAEFIKNHPRAEVRRMNVMIIFEEEIQLEKYIFMKKNGIYAMTKYRSVERWVEKISAILRKDDLR